MRLSFLSKKPIILECVTNKSHVYEYAKPNLAKKFIPDWWKEVPSSYTIGGSDFLEYPTIKNCAGFIDYYRSGVMLPMWSDLRVKIGQLGSTTTEWAFSDGESRAEVHPPNQTSNRFPDTKIAHLKPMSPWLFMCAEDIKWYWGAPFWSQESFWNYTMPPGIVSYRYQFGTHINIMFKRTDAPQIFDFAFGTAMAHIVPLSERPLVIKHRLVSDEEFNKINNLQRPVSFIKKFIKIKQTVQNGGCPFHK